MKETGLLVVAHDEHEGLLTVGASERAHGGCRTGQARVLPYNYYIGRPDWVHSKVTRKLRVS